MNRHQMKKKKRKLRPAFKRLILFFLFILILFTGYFGYLFFNTLNAANESYSELERGRKSKLRNIEVKAGKDPISILILGVENYSSGGGNGRTDTLKLATLNPDTKTMKLVSIPRDTEVYIEGEDKTDKINHAFVFGGKEGTIDTVENFLEIPIDYYATVNFDAFKEVIDEIGGIAVDVPFDFWEKSDEDNSRINFTEGEMNLDGEEALAYARMRKRDPRGDFGRNERQQQIITAAIDKLMSPNNLLKIDDIASHIGNNVETNMSIREALGIQQKYRNFDSSDIEKLSVIGEDDYQDGVYYFKPDEQAIEVLKKELKVHLGLINDNGSNEDEFTKDDGIAE